MTSTHLNPKWLFYLNGRVAHGGFNLRWTQIWTLDNSSTFYIERYRTNWASVHIGDGYSRKDVRVYCGFIF